MNRYESMFELVEDNSSVFCGDCLDIMKDIPDKSVDMILCDLPYEKLRATWDVKLNLTELWKQYKRIIKDDGAIVLTGNEPFSTLLRRDALDIYKYDWKWIKNKVTSFANANYRPMSNYEDILIFSKANASSGGKNNPMKFFPQNLVEVNKRKTNKKNRQGLVSHETNNVGRNNKMEQGGEYTQKYTNYPKNILYFDCEKKYVHPTQKPVELFEYLIKTYSKEGDLVLDNCAGSGTTGVACLKTNRRFILIEKEKKYVDIIKERLGINDANALEGETEESQ